MKFPIALYALVVASACVQIKDRSDTVGAKPKIDTSSGALAVSTGVVDTTPASVVPKTPPLIGADSLATGRMGSTAITRALQSDTLSMLRVVDSAPAAQPLDNDLNVLRREMIIPVHGYTAAMLRDSYNETRDGVRKHEALDILASRGTPVLSAANGRILKLFESKAGGHMIYAADSSEHFILMYAHLDSYQPGLIEGQRLVRGQQIGVVGTSGNAPVNVPHLHFAIASSPDVRIWWKGAPVNPYPLLTN